MDSKQYGIRHTEKDNTPGFRDKTIRNYWYRNEEERDKALEQYKRPRQLSPKDQMIEMELGDYIDHTYEPIER